MYNNPDHTTNYMDLSGLVATVAAVASARPVPAAVAVIVMVAAIIDGVRRVCARGQQGRRGLGSGENDRWNRRIRTERPVFPRRHHKLEDVWVYAGAGAAVNMDAVRKGGDLAVSAHDAATGFPLSGHLQGRHTWRVDKRASAAAKAAQDALTFSAADNPNAGDKLLRAQLLVANGGDPADANPPPPRGAPTVSAADALALGWEWYSKLLTDDGHFAGDYGGPHFLLPGA